MVALNGDWLVADQDGFDDPGRDEKVGCRNPAFGLTADGKIVLVVQRTSVAERPPPHPEGLLNSIYCISSDNGKSYDYMGYVDPLRPRGHFGSSSHVLLRDGVLYMVAYSLDGPVLYTSEDNASSWQKRSTVFQPSEFHENPYYPTITFRPDGSLLCQCHLDQSMENYQKVSRDDGYTWSGLKPANLRLRHPVLTYMGEVLVAVGRLMPVALRTGFYLSGDDGGIWAGPFDLAPDLPNGGGGYTAVIPLGDRAFIVFSYCIPPARDANLEPNSIQGVILKNISI